MFCQVIVVVVVFLFQWHTPTKFDNGPVHIIDLLQVDLSS